MSVLTISGFDVFASAVPDRLSDDADSFVDFFR